MRLDDSRIRVDDLELAETVQAEAKRRWPVVDPNLPGLETSPVFVPIF